MLRYLTVALTALLAVLLLLEGTVRALGLNWRILARRPDPTIGVMYPAGTVVRWGKEGYGVTHYVADGEIATPHNEGMEILVLGDSHTEAYQVDDQDKYVSVAETLLWNRGRRVNLRNLGVGARLFADYVYWVAVLRKRNPPPAAFVIQLNDDSFNTSFDTTGANFFRKTPNGEIELVHNPPDPASNLWLNPWWSYIRLFDYLEERYWILFVKPQVVKPQQARVAPPQPVPASEIEASVTSQLKLLTDQLGDVPTIYLRAPKWPYDNPPDDPTFITYQVLQKVQRWPLIDPGKELVRNFQRTHHDPRTFFNALPMHGHLNRDGEAVLGQMLADGIERMFFPPAPPKP